MRSARNEPAAPDTPQELKARALRVLARREQSRAELARKLAPHAESRAALEALLDDLARRRQLSDERFAEERAHVLSRKYGAARIRLELRSKGIAEETAERIADATGADDLERARSILRKRYASLPATREERARRMRFLQQRGFASEVIRAALGRDADED
jgi:regulatory protein